MRFLTCRAKLRRESHQAREPPQRRRYAKRHSFLSAFPVFVPSLSW
jgi:hypothetical protein